MIYHVTCSTDDNYVQHCMAMLCSLYENNKEHRFAVHLLVDSLSENSRVLISRLGERYQNTTIFHDIDAGLLRNIQLNDIQFNGKKMYSIATYYRMFLPSLLPVDIDRILYLDCDIIVLQNVSELYGLNMEGYGVAAVKDATPFDSYHRFKMGLGLQHSAFCAGMMMINLDYWRKNECQKKLLKYANRQWKAVYMQDQDALNYVFKDSWFQLPYKWGRTPLAVAPIDKSQRWFDILEYANQPSIIHYAAHVKPWLDVWFPLQKHYWHYLKLSGFVNSKKTHANTKLRATIRKTVIRYYINMYIHPFIPDSIELLLRDAVNIILFIFCIFKPHRFNEFMLKRWCQKYNM